MLNFMDTAFTNEADRETLFAHSKRNAQFEQNQVKLEIQENLKYRKQMIEFILQNQQNNYHTEEDLKRKSTPMLERIHDYC